MQEVLRAERENVEAKGRNFAKAVMGLKAGLAQDQPGVSSKRGRSPSPERKVVVVGNKRIRSEEEGAAAAAAGKQKKEYTKEERMRIEEKKRKLAEQYG
jgi:hypothetical protein